MSDAINKANERDTERAFRVGREIIRALSQPPAPVDLNLIRDGSVTTLRWIWNQQVPSERPRASSAQMHTMSEIATAIGAISDPLEGLATALRSASQECWRLGLAPVGIALHADHIPDPDAYLHARPDMAAQVTIAVSAVSREWIAANLRELAGEQATRGRDTS